MDELSNGQNTQELQNIITWSNYRNRIDVEYFFNYHEEHNTTSEMLIREQKIESIVGIDN